MENKINTILASAPGNKYDIYYTLCNEYMLNAAEPDKILAQILSYAEKIGASDDSEPTNITSEEIKNVESKYIALINEIVEVMVQENMELDSFYKRLYESIFLSNILQQNNKTRAVFLKILSENVRFLPYYQAENLLIMANDEYREHFQGLKPYILKAMHMLNRNFDSLTEIASQIYQIEKSVPNDTDQIVFLSAILGMIMHRNQEDEKPEDE